MQGLQDLNGLPIEIIDPSRPYTKMEILRKILSYYGGNINRRAIQNGQCRYRTEGGDVCAVGLCMDEDKYQIEFEGNSARDLIIDYGDDFLLPAYRGHEPGFWESVQELHDDFDYWDRQRGLSEAGVRKVERILKYWVAPSVIAEDIFQYGPLPFLQVSDVDV